MRSRRGTAALEFALVGTLFMIAVLAAIDLGRYFMVLQGLRTFVADAQRYGVVTMWWDGTGTHTATCAQVVSATGRGGVVGGLVSTSSGNCVTRQQTVVGGTNRVTVSVTVDVTIPLVIDVFGITTPRIQESSSVTFLL